MNQSVQWNVSQGFYCLWTQLSNEKNPGWLDYEGDYTNTTQLYRDYDKPL